AGKFVRAAIISRPKPALQNIPSSGWATRLPEYASASLISPYSRMPWRQQVKPLSCMHIHPIDLIADMNPNIIFRTPTVADGAGIWRIVQESGVLDLNSAYMYLLLSKDFADTCIVAERDNQLVGFATGYRPPKRPDSIFLWQIGIDAA